MIRVFHGDYLTTLLEKDVSSNKGGMFYNPTKTSNLLETFQMFSNLYDWLADGEMTGRFVFDIGQSLYESGKSEVGQYMMNKGHLSSNPILEGVVSGEVVKIRLALDYPMVPHSLSHIIEAYLNTTQYLSLSSSTYEPIDLENVLDVYWPVPLLPFSGLFTGPILTELMYRFKGGPVRHDSPSVQWLADSLLSHSSSNHPVDTSMKLHSSKPIRIEVGIFGGHMNNHPVGLMVLHRLLSLDKSLFRLTLVATPLHADHITRDIASRVDEIINIPMATDRAWQVIEQKLHLDILLFPDWQPFPDQLNILYSSRRIAPIQICFFVRGTTCGNGGNIDYYLLPEDIQDYYTMSTSNNYAISLLKNSDTLVLDNSSSKSSKISSSNYQISIPPWLESFHEQVVVIDWPIFTSHTVENVFKSVSAQSDETVPNGAVDIRLKPSESKPSNTQPRPNLNIYDNIIESEGQIFFDNQPVAIIASHPSYLHPLMDNVLIKILKETAACQLQILLVLPDIHFSDAMRIPKYRISWARRLVRRLWAKAGSLSNRLLPTPVSDKRLLSLFRQADLVLDTFPLGSSLHSHSIALSVGTPVVTMRAGIAIRTPIEDLVELKQSFSLNSRKYDKNPVYQYFMKHDIPWAPTNGQLGAFYQRLSRSNDSYSRNTIESALVANTLQEYEYIVTRLATDKEAAYRIRIKLLEAMDLKLDHEARMTRNTNQNYSASTIMNMNEELESFLMTVGKKYAVMRTDRVSKLSNPELQQARAHQQAEQTRMHKQQYEQEILDEATAHRRAHMEGKKLSPDRHQTQPLGNEHQRRKSTGSRKDIQNPGRHDIKSEDSSSKTADNGYFRSFLKAWIA